MSDPTDAWFIEQARANYQRDGEVEIDDNARVSRATPLDGGAYVQAWVWVDLPTNDLPQENE